MCTCRMLTGERQGERCIRKWPTHRQDSVEGFPRRGKEARPRLGLVPDGCVRDPGAEMWGQGGWKEPQERCCMNEGSDLFRTFRGYGEMEMEADGHQREKKGEPSPGTGRGGRKVQPPEEPWP